MGIDVKDYKMIYKDRVYNCLDMCPVFDRVVEENITKPKKLSVVFISDDNRIKLIEDEADKFQFVRR